MTLLTTIMILFGAGILSGLLSAIAGLASLVSYPVLLMLGLPAVSANTTNTAALIFTGAGSSLSSLKELRAHKQTTWHVVVFALIGAIIGSFILVIAPSTVFAKVVPFLVAGSGGLMIWSEFRRPQPTKQTATNHSAGNLFKNITILLVGIYIGYFGASSGMILLAILTVTLNQSFLVSNAIKNFTCFLANALSLVIYAFTTKIYWWMVVPMGLGMFIGGYLGAFVIRFLPLRPLRVGIAFLAFGLAAYLGYTAYF